MNTNRQPYTPKPLPGKGINTLLKNAKQCSVITVPGALDPHYVTYHKANTLFGQAKEIQDVVIPETGDILVLPNIKAMHEYAARFSVVHVLTGDTSTEHRKLLLDAFCVGSIALAVSSGMLEVILAGSRERQSATKRIHWLTLGSLGRIASVLKHNQTPVTFYVHEKINAFESACVKRGLYALGDYGTPTTELSTTPNKEPITCNTL